MVDSSNMDTPDTYFAPAERADIRKLQAAKEDFVSSRIAPRLLDAVPDPALVLYETRQIIIANAALMKTVGMNNMDEMMGMRPGELLECVHSDEMPGGCGTSKACRYCGAGQAIVDCIVKGKITAQECRIRTKGAKDGGALDVFVHATPIVARSRDYVVLHMRDVSGDRRRAVLEKIFLHDLSNTAFGLRSIADSLRSRSLESGVDKELRETLYQAAVQITDELEGQRALLRAETGDLIPVFSTVSVVGQLELVCAGYSQSELGAGKSIVVESSPGIKIVTDAMLLQRILSNLVKNALEASASGGTVTLSAYESGDDVRFVVGNQGVMPEEVQMQVFQRSFSTKDKTGRGIGTYSVRLLAERYLGGYVGFTSHDPEGTHFIVTLPKSGPIA